MILNRKVRRCYGQLIEWVQSVTSNSVLDICLCTACLTRSCLPWWPCWKLPQIEKQDVSRLYDNQQVSDDRVLIYPSYIMINWPETACRVKFFTFLSWDCNCVVVFKSVTLTYVLKSVYLRLIS